MTKCTFGCIHFSVLSVLCYVAVLCNVAVMWAMLQVLAFCVRVVIDVYCLNALIMLVIFGGVLSISWHELGGLYAVGGVVCLGWCCFC